MYFTIILPVVLLFFVVDFIRLKVLYWLAARPYRDEKFVAMCVDPEMRSFYPQVMVGTASRIAVYKRGEIVFDYAWSEIINIRVKKVNGVYRKRLFLGVEVDLSNGGMWKFYFPSTWNMVTVSSDLPDQLREFWLAT